MLGTADGLALDADVDGVKDCRADDCAAREVDCTSVLDAAEDLALGIDVDGWMGG